MEANIANVSMIYSLVYISSATNEFAEKELRDLLKISRANNSAQQITGLLLYGGGNFFQVLEGTRASVEALFTKIMADPRHKGGIRLLTKEAPVRRFPDWSMGYKRLSDQEFAESGFSDLLERRRLVKFGEKRLDTLLGSFRKTVNL